MRAIRKVSSFRVNGTPVELGCLAHHAFECVAECAFAPLGSAPVDGWKLGDSTQIAGVMPYAVDPDAAKRLWALSEHLLQ